MNGPTPPEKVRSLFLQPYTACLESLKAHFVQVATTGHYIDASFSEVFQGLFESKIGQAALIQQVTLLGDQGRRLFLDVFGPPNSQNGQATGTAVLPPFYQILTRTAERHGVIRFPLQHFPVSVKAQLPDAPPPGQRLNGGQLFPSERFRKIVLPGNDSVEMPPVTAWLFYLARDLSVRPSVSSPFMVSGSPPLLNNATPSSPSLYSSASSYSSSPSLSPSSSSADYDPFSRQVFLAYFRHFVSVCSEATGPQSQWSDHQRSSFSRLTDVCLAVYSLWLKRPIGEVGADVSFNLSEALFICKVLTDMCRIVQEKRSMLVNGEMRIIFEQGAALQTFLSSIMKFGANFSKQTFGTVVDFVTAYVQCAPELQFQPTASGGADQGNTAQLTDESKQIELRLQAFLSRFMDMYMMYASVQLREMSVQAPTDHLEKLIRLVRSLDMDNAMWASTPDFHFKLFSFCLCLRDSVPPGFWTKTVADLGLSRIDVNALLDQVPKLRQVVTVSGSVLRPLRQLFVMSNEVEQQRRLKLAQELAVLFRLPPTAYPVEANSRANQQPQTSPVVLRRRQSRHGGAGHESHNMLDPLSNPRSNEVFVAVLLSVIVYRLTGLNVRQVADRQTLRFVTLCLIALLFTLLIFGVPSFTTMIALLLIGYVVLHFRAPLRSSTRE